MLDNFEFIGFNPTESERLKAQSIYSELENISPYDSAIQAEIFKHENSFLCSIRVSTNYKIFSDKVEHAEFESALTQTYKEIKSKIDKWKMRRIFEYSAPQKAVV